MLKLSILPGLVLFIILLSLSACGEPAAEDLIMEGEDLYIVNCARCHQVDGTGAEGQFPRLAGNPVVTLNNPAPVIQAVLYGRGSMPAFQGALSQEEAAAIISYIRNAWGNQATGVLPRQVR